MFLKVQGWYEDNEVFNEIYDWELLKEHAKLCGVDLENLEDLPKEISSCTVSELDYPNDTEMEYTLISKEEDLKFEETFDEGEVDLVFFEYLDIEDNKEILEELLKVVKEKYGITVEKKDYRMGSAIHEAVRQELKKQKVEKLKTTGNTITITMEKEDDLLKEEIENALILLQETKGLNIKFN